MTLSLRGLGKRSKLRKKLTDHTQNHTTNNKFLLPGRAPFHSSVYTFLCPFSAVAHFVKVHVLLFFNCQRQWAIIYGRRRARCIFLFFLGAYTTLLETQRRQDDRRLKALQQAAPTRLQVPSLRSLPYIVSNSLIFSSWTRANDAHIFSGLRPRS